MDKGKIIADITELSHPDEVKGGIVLLIDKPLGWTSFDVVNKIRSRLRKLMNIKKIKVGHAGTLDPLATGLVIVCIGRATKAIDFFMASEKEYVARVKFGATTPSFDLETEIDQVFPVEHINREKLKKTLEDFCGIQQQIPPAFSAVKINGTRAYHLARNSKEVNIEAREVIFHEIKLLDFQNYEADIYLRCSKGTYIRSFARDLGKALKSGAHLSGLRRTGIGQHKVSDAMGIETFDKQCDALNDKWLKVGLI
jgi:tRNA pseudouridine55 synthase